jgi:hypothetical protein
MYCLYSKKSLPSFVCLVKKNKMGGYAASMEGARNANIILVGKPYGKEQVWRHKQK